MRNQDDLIQHLFTLYAAIRWDDMEEYFEAAYAVIFYHGGRFKNIDDVRENVKKEVFNSVVDDNNSRWYGFACDDCYPPFRSHMENVYDNSIEITNLDKYNDSEEGWREEINAGPESLDYFGIICNKFITFKY